MWCTFFESKTLSFPIFVHFVENTVAEVEIWMCVEPYEGVKMEPANYYQLGHTFLLHQLKFLDQCSEENKNWHDERWCYTLYFCHGG